MPFITSAGVRLAYEEHGSGPPLLLIAGLGCARWMWWKTLPGLAPHFRVVAYDNRGVGESDQPDEPYSMAAMAEDARALLDHLGLDRVDVLGISMGGYIAQELALAHPQRVRRLVLGATGLRGSESGPEFRAAVAAAHGMAPEAFLRRLLPLLVAPGYWDRHPEEREAVVRMRLQALPLEAAYRRQAAAAHAHDTHSRAAAIRAPGLVLSGACDLVVPPESTARLAA